MKSGVIDLRVDLQPCRKEGFTAHYGDRCAGGASRAARRGGCGQDRGACGGVSQAASHWDWGRPPQALGQVRCDPQDPTHARTRARSRLSGLQKTHRHRVFEAREERDSCVPPIQCSCQSSRRCGSTSKAGKTARMYQPL